MASHRHFLRLLEDPFSPFPPPPPSSSSCPFLLDGVSDYPSPFPAASPFPDLDDLLLPPAPALDPFLAFTPTPLILRDLTNRVAALEVAVATARRRPGPPATRKRTYVTEAGGRKVKWTSVEKPRAGERTLKWEAEIKSPDDDGFDRKWKWEAKGGSSAASARKLKWGAAVKGKGCLEPWSQAYTWEEDFTASDSDKEEEERAADKNKAKKITMNKNEKKEVKAVKKEKKCPFATVKIEEISEDNDAGCVAIKKAFAKGNGKGKRKELSPQDAALLIQMTYRAHLAHRSQVLRCLRDLAVAKAKLKELRSLFYNISYRHRIAHDHEERQRFSEKIIVLLITVDALEGPDYMVRTAKKSMLEELEAMLEVVDPQPPGKQRSLSRRKFDLPEGGAIPDEKTAAVNKAIRIIEEGK
ncbi:BAG family molecular chaperone regulator 7 [Zea mays]|uniref:IQ calmodulin-binding motif family protein n=3 Tax=Zea mays TaxID=4577 RepID=B6TKK9_MAIZE|nr:IQ calmodulin-binding motif family protein [Zea mays]ACG37642.1 IQ calmodulin-binding motif family protein [Zea mays]AQL02702.1 IQ calmodulin-binding motif family protein [Zea mays]PWZ04988.1 BAG family molecular chaperone regulator 7 [Zea mays]|eukprot:NP_001150057.1 IQ calmodulin-binding motif family protein [Zea mays]